MKKKAPSATAGVDLLARQIDRVASAWLEEVNATLLAPPPVAAFVEKVRRGKWCVALSVHGTVVWRSPETWRTRRAATSAAMPIQIWAPAIYGALSKKDDPLAGLERWVGMTKGGSEHKVPVSYTSKAKR